MSRQQKKAHKLSSAPQQVKILGGCWRGTNLPVLQKDDVRPTPNRVRETVFNWLQPIIAGSTCLDLFAGSGALGFEAASRGAHTVILVDNERQITRQLLQQREKLSAQQIQVVNQDGSHYLQQSQQCFDIIFLDPPFAALHPLTLLDLIDQHHLLKPQGLVYAEFSAKNAALNLPQGWRWQRQSTAGEVEYGLLCAS